MALIPSIQPGDWDQVDRNFKKLVKFYIGPDAFPTYSGLKLTGLTANSLIYPDSSKLFTSLGVAANGKIPIGSTGAPPVLAEITGTANQIISTAGAGSITLSTPQNIHTGATNFTVAGATIDGIIFGDVYDVQEEPTGFVDRVATLSWNDGDQTLTITGDHDIYIYGVKTTKSTDSIQITDATDLYWIYYNAAGVLTASTTHPGWALPIMATVYWNTDGGGGSYNKGLAGDERHGLVMDWATHEYLHNTVGSRYENGLAGTFDSTTLSIATGEWHDEDIEHILASPETTCNVLYKNGSAAWEWDAGASVYYKLNGTALRYNNGNALADCTSNQYMAMWIFATNDISVPIVALVGQRQDNKLKDARTNNTYESLSFGELPFWEMKVLYRVILRSTGSPPTYVETQDLRSISNLSAGTYIATSHSVLTDLTNDDHTQYLLADGTRALAGAWDMGSQALTNVNIDSGDIHNDVTHTQWDAAYSHSLLSSGNPHNVTPTELSLVIGTNTQAWDASLDSVAGLTYVSPSFIKLTAEDAYAIRTLAEVKTDLSLNLVENTALSTWAGSTNITTLGTIATGAWAGTTIPINKGGSGQTAAQAAIDVLSAVGAATNEHVLTKDTGTGNAKWKAAAGGGETWIGLSDTDPANFTGSAGKIVRVNATPDALEFFDIDDLAADAAPVESTDYVMTWDATASAHKKVLLSNITASNVGFVSYTRVYLSSPQTIAKDIFDLVEFDTTDYDNNSEWTNYKWTCKIAGYYHFDTAVAMDVLGDGIVVYLVIKLNNTTFIGAANQRIGSNGEVYNEVSGDYYFAVNDYLEVYLFHTHGSNQPTDHGISDPFFNIHRFGGGTDGRVKIDTAATADYLGAASGDGALRTGAGLSYADGGSFVTLAVGVDGLAEIGAALVDADTFIVDDGDSGTTKKCLMSRLKTYVGASGAHAILDGSVHTDSVADGVTRGSIIYGNSTPKWDELALGAANTFLGSDGTDLSYIPLGVWTTPTFNAGDFTAGGSQTWTVGAGDVTNYQYMIIGKTMYLNYYIVATSVGGTPHAELRIAIPASKIAAKTAQIPGIVNNAAQGNFGGMITINSGGAYLVLYRNLVPNTWAAATNTTNVFGSVVFEIQ